MVSLIGLPFNLSTTLLASSICLVMLLCSAFSACDIINSISDAFSPEWKQESEIGRADPKILLTGFGRTISLDLTLAAGSQAELLRNNPLLKYIFEQLRNSYITDWSGADLDDVDKREHAFYLLRALTEIEGQIDSIIASGNFAKEQIDSMLRK